VDYKKYCPRRSLALVRTSGRPKERKSALIIQEPQGRNKTPRHQSEENVKGFKSKAKRGPIYSGLSERIVVTWGPEGTRFSPEAKGWGGGRAA